jgi:transcriptional regulator with XRE-family HTH domain
MHIVPLKLKEIRGKFGLTQKELAERLGTTQQTIARWESGKTEPSIANLKDLAIILGTSVNELIDNETIIKTSIMNDFCRTENNKVDGFWGHLGIKICRENKTIWYPISANTYSSLFKMFQFRGWCYTETLNNKVLLMNRSSIHRFCLLDDACDPLENDWDVEWHALEPFPLEIYNELEQINSSSFDGSLDVEMSDQSSEEFKKTLKSIIDDNKLDDKKVRNITSDICIRYTNGDSEYYETAIDDYFTMIMMKVEGLEDDENVDPIVIDDDISDNAIFFFNPKDIAVIEIPLLKVNA